MATTTTTRRTTVVTEVPDERRWQGRDWLKALVAGGLALSLLRPGASAVPVAAPTAVALASPVPAVVSTVLPSAVPTVAATVAPTVAPAAVAPLEPPAISAPAGGFAVGPVELQGTGTPGSLVEILIDGASAGTATVGADGRWTLPAVLAAGAAAIVARAVDASGAVLAEAAPLEVTAGGGAAGGSVAGGGAIAAPTFNLPPGELASGPAVLSGTGTPGSQVRVRLGGVEVGTAVVGPGGDWELDVILSEGTLPVVVEALDAGGAVVAAAEPGALSVVGGLGVTVAEPAEGAEVEPGPVTISGNGQPGTVLEILDGDRVLGQVTIDPAGTWTTQVPLEAGTASISVREQGGDQILTRPVRVTVGGPVTAAAGCGDALTVNCPAWVTRSGGLQLRMRSAPAITPDNIVARLPIGTEMTLEEGPQSAEGLSWWRVTTSGGNSGWVAGDNLVPQPD